MDSTGETRGTDGGVSSVGDTSGAGDVDGRIIVPAVGVLSKSKVSVVLGCCEPGRVTNGVVVGCSEVLGVVVGVAVGLG